MRTLSMKWLRWFREFNFGDHEQTVPFDFPFSGDYREELHGYDNLKDIAGGKESWLTVPSRGHGVRSSFLTDGYFLMCKGRNIV